MVGSANERLARLSQGHFDLLINAANDLMIIFARVDQALQNPVFIYDGRSNAFLCKNHQKEADKVFTEIPTEAQESLKKAKDILCVEVDREHIYTEYTAKVEVKQWPNASK